MKRNRQSTISYLERLDRLPPNICRLIARTKTPPIRPLTIAEIAKAAGLPWQKVARLALKRSWKDVPVGLVDRFRAACGIPIKEETHQLQFIARQQRRPNGFAYLDNLPKSVLDYRHRKRFHKTLMKVIS